MGTNIFSNRVNSPNGLSPFERGLSTDGFQTGDHVKTAGTKRSVTRKEFAPPIAANTDLYPGHGGYLYYVRQLLDGIKDDTIYLPSDSVMRETAKYGSLQTGEQVTDVTITKTESRVWFDDNKKTYCKMTVDQLVKALSERFYLNNRLPTGISNWEWCDPDVTITPQDLEAKINDVLKSPQGFPSKLNPKVNPLGFGIDSWDTWAGTHWGIWMSDWYGKVYLDTASWQYPIQVPTDDPDDLLDSTTGKPRVYDHQHVTWLERTPFEAVEKDAAGKVIRTNIANEGWNSSHPDVSYVWGWDPKDWGEAKKIKYPGTWGVHVGFPFLFKQPDDIRFILWLTPSEVFLESVNLSRQAEIAIDPTKTEQFSDKAWKSKTIPGMKPTTRTGHPKSSTALNGRGQWVIQK